MSVAILKADDELGYWEYSVQTEEYGEWNIQFSRTEEASEEHSELPGMYRMHVNMAWNGEEFFNSWRYGDGYPFLTEHDLNGVIAAAAVASMAYWYTASARYHEMRSARKELQERIGDMGELVFVGPDNEVLDEDLSDVVLPEDDCLRIGPHAKATYAVYMELHHYAMATTDKDWLQQRYGKTELEPSHWGCEHGEHD